MSSSKSDHKKPDDFELFLARSFSPAIAKCQCIHTRTGSLREKGRKANVGENVTPKLHQILKYRYSADDTTSHKPTPDMCPVSQKNYLDASTSCRSKSCEEHGNTEREEEKSHISSCSLQNKLQDRVLCHLAVSVLDGDDKDWKPGVMRPRVSSMPIWGTHRWSTRSPPLAALKIREDVHKVRSFAITPHGLINQGDLMIAGESSTSVESEANATMVSSVPDMNNPGHSTSHMIFVFGEPGVGKRALIHTFTEPDDCTTMASSLGK